MIGDPAVELVLGLGIDHRPDLGGKLARIADAERAGGARDHIEDGFGHVLLQAEQPQRRAALAGGAKGRSDHIVGDLFRQRGGIDDHRVDAAGLGDQRHDRRILRGQRAIDRTRHLGRAGEGDAGDTAIGDERGADLAVAWQQLQRSRWNAGLDAGSARPRPQ